MTRKKQRGVKTTSRKTGAILLILFMAGMAFFLTVLFYGMVEREKEIQKEDEWRNQSCEVMIKDFENDRQPWKFATMTDRGCF